MAIVSIPSETLNKILTDVEVLIEDVAILIDQNEMVRKRLQEIKENPSIARPEKDMDIYLKKRGVKIE